MIIKVPASLFDNKLERCPFGHSLPAGMLTTQMISSAVCALTTLASRADAARSAAAANAAGSGWRPDSFATRIVMS
jgi:hypothetical protein